MQRRARRTPRWGMIFGTLLVINLGVGAWWSVATRITQVWVTGALQHDEPRIRQILAQAANLPILRVDRNRLEWQMLQKPEVESARLAVTPFGTASLELTYRRPILVFEHDDRLVMSTDGSVFRLPKNAIAPGLPKLRLSKRLPPTLLTIASNWPAAKVAQLGVKVRTIWPQGDVRIDVDDRGVLCLNRGTGRVVLGSTDDLDKKVDVLRQRIAQDSNLLDRFVELNLTQPEKPSLVPRPSNASR